MTMHDFAPHMSRRAPALDAPRRGSARTRLGNSMTAMRPLSPRRPKLADRLGMILA